MKIDWKKELKFPSFRSRGRKSDGPSSISRPSLSGPELHAPKILVDLYADLRDRRLLPLVALLILAIVAAPILLNKRGDREEAPALTPAVAAGAEASDATFTVVPAEPGLHDYKKRLGHRTAVNPFRRSPEKRQAQAKGSSSSGGTETGPTSSGTATGAPEPTATIRIGDVTSEVPASSVETVTTESSKSESTRTESSTSESGPTESTGVESTPAPETSAPPATETHESAPPASTPPAAPSTEGKSSQDVVGYTIDAEAGFVPHAAEKTELAPMTKLPNPKHPLVLFMGLSKDHKRALFLMTSNVTAYYGGHCALDKQSCQLVEVKPGKGITFADGYGESRYKVHLKRIVPVRHFSK